MSAGRETRLVRWLTSLVATVAILVCGVGGAVTSHAAPGAGTTRVTLLKTYEGSSSSVHAHGAPLALRGPPSRTVIGSQVESVSVPRAGVAAKSADEFVDLASASRRSHILDGEVRPNGTFGGGHRPGTGFPGKSEFPLGWSDDKIMHEISDIATDPSLTWRSGNRSGDFFVNGTRGGIDIEVLIRNNQIWTGYPTNVARNPW